MKYVPNPAFAAELDRDPGVRDELGRRARSAASTAKTIGQSLGGTGAYAKTVIADDNRLLTTDPAGHIVEWGSINNPPYAPLRRAAESVGASYVDDKTGRSSEA